MQMESAEALGQLLTFTGCLVRKKPDLTRELVLAPVGSKQEQAALAQLTPFLSGCTYQGVTLRFTRPMLYGLIAEALYREGKAVAQPSKVVP